MADEDAIRRLRMLINQPDDVPPYTDEYLGELIDSFGGNINRSAATVWSQKASQYAELVNVQEGASRRELGSLYEQAMAMVRFYDGGDGDFGRRSSRTRPITRP